MARKKKTNPTANKSSLFDKTVDLINSKYGDNILSSFNQMAKMSSYGISTGSLALDSIICPNYGGMPSGRVIELYGDFSSGKTTVALGMAANVTANKRNVVYVDAENSLREDSVINSGMDVEYFRYMVGKDGNELANAILLLMKTGEVGMVVIDSVPTFKPSIYDDKEETPYDNTKIGYHARFLSEVIPDLATAARENDVIVVLLNQVRANIGGYGQGTKAFGGHVVTHMDSVRVRLTGCAKSSTNQIKDVDGNLVGQYTTAKADKNKVYIPMGTTSIPIFLGRGINPYMELAMLSQQVGVVKGTAGRFKLAGSDEQLAHGINNFTELLHDDVDLYKSLRGKVIESLSLEYDPDIKVINAFHDSEFNKREFIVCDKKFRESLGE